MILIRKKVSLVVLAVIFTMALTICIFRFSASAATTDIPCYTREEIDAYLKEHGEEYYAYMILDEADDTLKPIILEARWRIISNTTWVDDELNGHIEDEAGNIIEIVPHFHDIFPEDWEIQPGRGLY